MIPRANVIDWRSQAPWASDAQIEQDLVVSRAIVDLFSDELLGRELAFRGGTALHKLVFARAGRYSEDIDLVQVNGGPAGALMSAVRSRLDPWLGKPNWKQSEGRVTFSYRFESEIQPVTPLRLKVEINTREHFTVLGHRRVPFSIESPWFSGQAEVFTYSPEELLGTKLRALYQRRKGRDLFDLSEALTRLPGLDTPFLVDCFQKYLAHGGLAVSRMDFRDNLARKLEDPFFVNDVESLLPLGTTFDLAAAHRHVEATLLPHLPGES